MLTVMKDLPDEHFSVSCLNLIGNLILFKRLHYYTINETVMWNVTSVETNLQVSDGSAVQGKHTHRNCVSWRKEEQQPSWPTRPPQPLNGSEKPFSPLFS